MTQELLKVRMPSVRLGSNGEIEVLDPGTPQGQAEAEEALLRFIRALAEFAEAEDWKEQEYRRMIARSLYNNARSAGLLGATNGAC